MNAHTHNERTHAPRPTIPTSCRCSQQPPASQPHPHTTHECTHAHNEHTPINAPTHAPTQADIPDLVSILRSVTPAEESAMRLRMADHYKAYIWEPAHGGAAYNYTLRCLYKRLHNMWGELY
jgi:hypothetical protein